MAANTRSARRPAWVHRAATLMVLALPIAAACDDDSPDEGPATTVADVGTPPVGTGEGPATELEPGSNLPPISDVDGTGGTGDPADVTGTSVAGLRGWVHDG